MFWTFKSIFEPQFLGVIFNNSYANFAPNARDDFQRSKVEKFSSKFQIGNSGTKDASTEEVDIYFVLGFPTLNLARRATK